MNLYSATGRRQRGPRGFIVVAVLWILAALSALVLIYLTYVTNTAIVIAGTTDRIQNGALATAAVELSALKLSAVKGVARPSSGTFNARIGAARISVLFRSEAARIDLNAAPRQLLAGLMIGIGAAPLDAADYAERIVAWRTPAQDGDNDPENASYRTAGLAYLPRHGPFPATEELWLVHGIPPVIAERMLPWVTVFSGQPAINLLDAAPQVVAALPGMNPEALQTILSQRGDLRGDPQALLTLAGEGATLSASKTYRVAVTMELDGGRRMNAEAVILLLEDADEPYRVLSWTNGFDGSTTLQPRRAGFR